MSDVRNVANIEAYAYATGKLAAAAVLSASPLQSSPHEYYLGLIGTAYTAAHEAMELLLKLYLTRGAAGMAEKEAWGHDLGDLFMKWGDQGRTKAELAYQRGVLDDLKMNRIYQAASRATLNLDQHGDLPADYSKRKAEYDEAFQKNRVTLLHEGSPTVRDVVGNLDAVLGARNITWLCKRTHLGEIKGFSCNPDVWYPEELLSIEWDRFDNATGQGESLGFLEAFLRREGTTLVYEGWRYLAGVKLEKTGIVFHGLPAKMILMAQKLDGVVLDSI